MEFFRSHVLICGGTGCHSSGSADVMETFKSELAENKLEKEIKVVQTGCFGLCEVGPIVIVYPEGAFYSRIKDEDVTKIVSEHLVKGRIVKDLLYHDSIDQYEEIKSLDEVPFYQRQKRVALRNCG